MIIFPIPRHMHGGPCNKKIGLKSDIFPCIDWVVVDQEIKDGRV